MKYLLINLTPDKGSGFGNQIYIISKAVSYANSNGYDVIFLSKFLKQINTTETCNISEIIDLHETNKLIIKYNVIIADLLNYNLNIIECYYNNRDILYYIEKFVDKNGKLNIPCNFNLNDINKEYIEKTEISLNIKYKINEFILNKTYKTTNGYLNEDITIDLINSKMYNISVFDDNSHLFYYTKRNIIFNKIFKLKVDEYIQEKINTYNINNISNISKKINCIHIRLENDAIEHWSKEVNIIPEKYKISLENTYIKLIKETINKNELTLLLSHNYENKVIDFLKENNYNYLTTPKWDNYRDISAIYDCIVGSTYCNNVYFGIYESSFSFTIYHRNENIKKFVILYYTNIQGIEESNDINKLVKIKTEVIKIR